MLSSVARDVWGQPGPVTVVRGGRASLPGSATGGGHNGSLQPATVRAEMRPFAAPDSQLFASTPLSHRPS